jgi:hypothetical protein
MPNEFESILLEELQFECENCEDVRVMHAGPVAGLGNGLIIKFLVAAIERAVAKAGESVFSLTREQFQKIVETVLGVAVKALPFPIPQVVVDMVVQLALHIWDSNHSTPVPAV